MSNRRLPEWLRRTTDFAIYELGLLVVVIGSATCYVLVLEGMASEVNAVLGITIATALGITLVTAGVLLRAHRMGREVVGPLVFGTGLFVASIGPLIGYTLFLCQAISETGALTGIALVMILSILLAVAGVMRRVRYVEEKQVRRVVMKPLHRIRSRDVREEERDDETGKGKEA